MTTEIPGWVIACLIFGTIAGSYLLFELILWPLSKQYKKLAKAFNLAVRDVNGPKASPFYGELKKKIGGTAWFALDALMNPMITAWNASLGRKRK